MTPWWVIIIIDIPEILMSMFWRLNINKATKKKNILHDREDTVARVRETMIQHVRLHTGNYHKATRNVMQRAFLYQQSWEFKSQPAEKSFQRLTVVVIAAAWQRWRLYSGGHVSCVRVDRGLGRCTRMHKGLTSHTDHVGNRPPADRCWV